MFKDGEKVLIKAKVLSTSQRFFGYECEIGSGSIRRILEVSEECVISDKTYEQGLADAWELAKKIQLQPDDGGLSKEDIFEIFGICFIDTIFKKNTYEEALAKIEAYEKEKAEIKVGDVVEGLSGYKAVVTVIGRDRIQVMFDDGSHTEWNPKEIKNTGKHIDIESFLKQIGE